jgi:hypothetical protein
MNFTPKQSRSPSGPQAISWMAKPSLLAQAANFRDASSVGKSAQWSRGRSRSPSSPF